MSSRLKRLDQFGISNERQIRLWITGENFKFYYIFRTTKEDIVLT